MKTIEELLHDLFFNCWGATKTIKVIGYTVIGASIGCVAGATLIKDESEIINNEKENG